MIDSLVAYPLDPVQLEMGLNVIGCASPKIFMSYLRDFRKMPILLYLAWEKKLFWLPKV